MPPLDFLRRSRRQQEPTNENDRQPPERRRPAEREVEVLAQALAVERRQHAEALQQQQQQHALEMERVNRELAARQEQERREQQRLEREQRERARREAARQSTDPEALQRLRGLIRQRYELDVAIWAKKGVRKPNRPMVVEKMEQADAVLKQIMTIVATWENNDDGTWTPAEWELAHDIYTRLMEPGKKDWSREAPWD